MSLKGHNEVVPALPAHPPPLSPPPGPHPTPGPLNLLSILVQVPRAALRVVPGGSSWGQPGSTESGLFLQLLTRRVDVRHTIMAGRRERRGPLRKPQQDPPHPAPSQRWGMSANPRCGQQRAAAARRRQEARAAESALVSPRGESFPPQDLGTGRASGVSVGSNTLLHLGQPTFYFFIRFHTRFCTD